MDKNLLVPLGAQLSEPTLNRLAIAELRRLGRHPEQAASGQALSHILRPAAGSAESIAQPAHSSLLGRVPIA